ncbi:hypothetical protein TruAng_012276 [Truncatella angustata]|nr:hypothetical protein TruAng_012276 [Truncatella angustata]
MFSTPPSPLLSVATLVISGNPFESLSSDEEDIPAVLPRTVITAPPSVKEEDNVLRDATYNKEEEEEEEDDDDDDNDMVRRIARPVPALAAPAPSISERRDPCLQVTLANPAPPTCSRWLAV